MWSRFGTPGILLSLVALASCGIPPYSSVREVDVRGLYTLKVRGAVFEDVDLTEEGVGVGNTDTEEPLDRMSSYGIEIERNLGDQWTASFAFEKRQYEPEGAFPNIRSDQIRASFRRYFGDRALSAFLAGDLIYGLGLNFQDNSGDTENWLGYGAGGGVNLALSENFSIETYLMYESMPEVVFFPSSGSTSNFNYGFSGLVAYVALGLHF